MPDVPAESEHSVSEPAGRPRSRGWLAIAFVVAVLIAVAAFVFTNLGDVPESGPGESTGPAAPSIPESPPGGVE